jgi:hypothetical protein
MVFSPFSAEEGRRRKGGEMRERCRHAEKETQKGISVRGGRVGPGRKWHFRPHRDAWQRKDPRGGSAWEFAGHVGSGQKRYFCPYHFYKFRTVTATSVTSQFYFIIIKKIGISGVYIFAISFFLLRKERGHAPKLLVFVRHDHKFLFFF